MDVARDVLREPQVKNVAHYARRVGILIIVFPCLFFSALTGIVVIVTRGEFLVTLAQRSNVETLTLAFLLLFFVYLLFLSTSGVLASMRVLSFRVMARFMDFRSLELRKVKALGRRRADPSPMVATNVIIELEGSDRDYFEIPIEDEVGSLGVIRISGARMEHRGVFRNGTYSIFPFIAQQIQQMLRRRGEESWIDVVEWLNISDENLERYLGSVEFARNLSRHLGCLGLWPTVVLRTEDLQELQGNLTRLCSILREELFFPHWEYSGDHKLPIIPEPLGFISLSRNETRVDPITSMTAVAVVSLGVLLIVFLMIFFPPWVPGA